MPVEIKPRLGHSAVVFGCGTGFKVMVLFGGSRGSHLSETTLLLLSESTLYALMHPFLYTPSLTAQVVKIYIVVPTVLPGSYIVMACHIPNVG